METAILNRVNEKFSGTFNDFDTKEHCSHSDYFVDQVKWAIGEVAFFEFDYELTKDEENRILEAFFAC